MQKIRRGVAGSLLTAAVLMCFPALAHADAGIPMLPVKYPALLLYLLPVIAIEFFYLKSQLHTNARRTAVAVTGVNMVTMGLGYPLVWGIFTVLDSVLRFPVGPDQVFSRVGWMPVWVCARLFPNWDGLQQQQIWPVLCVFVVLLVPGFLLSGAIKTWMITAFDLLSYRGKTKTYVWEANRLSYLFLAIAGCVVLYTMFSQM